MNGITIGIIGGLIGGFLVLCFWELVGPYVNSKREMKISNLTSHWGKFDEIECRELKVVERDGTARVILTTDFETSMRPSERVTIYGHAFRSGIVLRGTDTDDWASAALIATSDGGRMYLHSAERPDIVQVCYKDEGAMLSLGIDEYGGRVEVNNKDWISPGVALGVNKDSGYITTDKAIVVIDRFGNVKTKNP